jgi:hypothetical protein
MPRGTYPQFRDGAHVKAKFALPQQTSLILSCAKENGFVADVVVELRGCSRYICPDDFPNILCQNGKASSCTASDGKIRIKAQGPLTWSGVEDVETLHNAIRSGLQEASLTGADRVGVLLKFSLASSGNRSLTSIGDCNSSVAFVLAQSLSMCFPTGIQEVNVCVNRDYDADALGCTELVKACQDLVSLGHLLPYNAALPRYESMEQNQALQEKVGQLKKRMQAMEEQRQIERFKFQMSLDEHPHAQKQMSKAWIKMKIDYDALQEQKKHEVDSLRNQNPLFEGIFIKLKSTD